MKKWTVCMLVATMAQVGLCQEKGTSEIGASVGFITSNGFLDAVSNLAVSGTSAGNTTFANDTETPGIALYYKYAVANNWMVFADGVYQSNTKDVIVNGSTNGDMRNVFLTFGVGTEYRYVHGDWFKLYSGLSVGYTSQASNYTGPSDDFEDGNDGYFNFQINGLGVRMGNTLAFTAELGLGYRGVINAGISYRF